MSKESPGNIPGFTKPFIISAKKTQKKGRCSGGILMYTKPKIRKHIKFVKGNYSTLRIRIASATLGLNIKKPVFCCFRYIKPYIKPDVSEYAFNKLENEVADFRKEGKVLLCGDFNARTGRGQ